MDNDVVFVAIIIVFFALMVVFVRACDRILGPDEDAGTPEAAEPERLAA